MPHHPKISLTDDKIDPGSILERVSSPNCGANLLFCGSTRRYTEGRETDFLTYECYEEMALKKLHELAALATEKWPIQSVAIQHRLGVVAIGETSIAIAIASPHRAAAFSAGKWLMDEIKKQVPIWKKETWADGRTEWQHPTPKQTERISEGKSD